MRGYFLCRFERVFFLLLFINFKKKEEIKEKKTTRLFSMLLTQ